MANELASDIGIAATFYSVLTRASDGKVWDGTTWIAASADDRSTSPVSMTRRGTTTLYQADQPAGIGVTPCTYRVYLQAGGSPAVTDVPVGVGEVNETAILAAAGLDLVMVESGLNARQALSIIAAGDGGFLSGAVLGPCTITISAAGVSGTPRVIAVVDGLGNRTSVTLHPPA